MRTENSSQSKKNLGKRILSFSHDLAHLAGEKVIQPSINISQYRMFERPDKNRRAIDRQMHRIFKRASTTIERDNLFSKLLFTQFALAVVLGEHVPYPLQWTPLPHELTAIPLPFDVHLNIPFPPGEILNHIPGVHLPTEFKSDGPFWPLLTSDIIMSGAVNIPNAIRAYREKRPLKSFWYTLSIFGAFSHLPIIFNSFWFELATRPAERKAGQVFAEKVEHVLEGTKPAEQPMIEPKSRLGKLLLHIPAMRKLREMSRSNIHISPENRHIFADAIQKRFTNKKTREWWESHLDQVEQNLLTNAKVGLPHEKERIIHHSQLQNGKRFSRRLWHTAWKLYHEHMEDRLDEKREAVQTARRFIHLSGK